MADDRIIQRIGLEGADDVRRQFRDIGSAGEQSFRQVSTSANSVNLNDLLSSIDLLTKSLNRATEAGRNTFTPLIQNANKARQEIKLVVDNTKKDLDSLSNQKLSLPIEDSTKQVKEFGNTSVSVFSSISDSLGVLISGFEKLTSSITGSKVALSGIAIGSGLVLGLNTLKNAVVGFSNASLADKLQSVLGDTVKKAVSEVDKSQKELTDKTEHIKHDTLAGKNTESVSVPETKALTDLKKAIADTRIEMKSMQGEDDVMNTGLTDTAIKALESARAFKEMGAELDLGKPIKPIDKLKEAFIALGVKSDIIKKQLHDFAIGIEAEFEKVQKIREEESSKLAKSSLDVAGALLHQKSSAESLVGAELALAEAEERLRVSKGGARDTGLDNQLRLEREELALSEAQLGVERAAFSQAQAAQSVRDAKKKAAEEQANSLPNLIKLVQSLESGVSVAGSKVNATAENIARGFVASLGTSAQAVKGFSGSLSDLDKNAPQLVPIFEKLADLFKGTKDSALNARVANILFSGSIDDTLLKALSKGKQGLEDARNLGKTVDNLQKNFSPDNLLKFGEQLLKITDIEERTKKSTDVLGDTFGKLFADSITNKVGTLRQAVAPFDDIVKTIGANIQQADLFKKSIDKLKESFLAAGLSSKRNAIDFGLLIAPAAIPIIDAFTKGIGNLQIDFKGLAETIGQTVKPVVEDFFTLLAGKGKQVDSADLGSSIGKSVNEIIIPAFRQLGEIATSIGKTIGQLFGGDVSGAMVILAGAVTLLIGPFNALAIAVLALFGSTSPAIEKFKTNLKSIGIDIDELKDIFSGFFKVVKDAFKDAFQFKLALDKNNSIIQLTQTIVEFTKTIPGAIVEIGALLLLFNRFAGPTGIAKVAVLEFSGALSALTRIAAITTAAFVILGTAFTILFRISPLTAAISGFVLLIAFSDKLILALDFVAAGLNNIIKLSNQLVGTSVLPENFFTGAGLFITLLSGIAIAIGFLTLTALPALANAIKSIGAALLFLSTNPIGIFLTLLAATFLLAYDNGILLKFALNAIGVEAKKASDLVDGLLNSLKAIAEFTGLTKQFENIQNSVNELKKDQSIFDKIKGFLFGKDFSPLPTERVRPEVQGPPASLPEVQGPPAPSAIPGVTPGASLSQWDKVLQALGLQTSATKENTTAVKDEVKVTTQNFGKGSIKDIPPGFFNKNREEELIKRLDKQRDVIPKQIVVPQKFAELSEEENKVSTTTVEMADALKRLGSELEKTFAPVKDRFEGDTFASRLEKTGEKHSGEIIDHGDKPLPDTFLTTKADEKQQRERELQGLEFQNKAIIDILDKIATKDFSNLEKQIGAPEQISTIEKGLQAEAVDELKSSFELLNSSSDQIASTFDSLNISISQIGTDLETFRSSLDTSEVKSAFDTIVAAAQQAAQALQQLSSGVSSAAPGKGSGGSAEGFAAGTNSPLQGPGTETSDSIPIWASKGEVVVQAPAVRSLVQTFGSNVVSLINNFHRSRFHTSDIFSRMAPQMHFATGGIVGDIGGHGQGSSPFVQMLHPVTFKLHSGETIGGFMGTRSAVHQMSRKSVFDQLTSTGKRSGSF